MFHQLKQTGLLLLILFMTNQHIMAQTNYETLWKSVAKLENDGKTKDAQKAVESIVETNGKGIIVQIQIYHDAGRRI